MTNYISIRSVLLDLSLVIPEREWDESKYLEWLYNAIGKFNLHSKLEIAYCLRKVESHRTQLPSDFKYVYQVVYKQNMDPNNDDLIKTLALPNEGIALRANQIFSLLRSWQPLKLASSTFSGAVRQIDFYQRGRINQPCQECEEYSIDTSGCVTTSFKDGYIFIAYLRNPVDKDGDLLIPDNDNLKEAMLHYVLYKYQLSRAFTHEVGAANLRDYHYQMFSQLKAKSSGELNSPTLDQMENIKNMNARLSGVQDDWNRLFSASTQPITNSVV